MKIVIIGQSAFGKSVLEALVDDGRDEIVGVFAPPVRPNASADPITDASTELGIPVFVFNRLRDREAIDQFKSLEPELCVMAFVTDIVPMEMINCPSLGTIQYHPSLLPLHRGPSSINWPIIRGETETGLTIFWPDEGLDTGPVLMQKRIGIGPEDTLGSIYFKRLFPLGVEALVESVGLARSGDAPRTAQDDSKATYEGWCKAEDVVIDWAAPTSTIYNMIRGADPQPGANTRFDGATISLYNASSSIASTENTGLESSSPEKGQDDMSFGPGRVIAIGEPGIAISTIDGRVNVGRVRAAGEKKIGAAEWATSMGLKVGDRFES